MTRKVAALLAVILASAAYTAFAELPAPGVLYPGYCGQQYPMLFAASLCGHVEPAGGAAVGRSVGTFVRGSNRSMQQGGIANPTWTELSTDQAGSWEHTDGLDYVIIEGVQVERLQNNWFTFEDWPAGQCITCTAVREASTLGPGGQAMRVNYSAGGGYFWEVSTSTGIAEGDWVSVCAYAWVESGTLDLRIRVDIGGVQPAFNDVTLTTTPAEHCVRAQHDGTAIPSNQTIYAQVFEDPVGDGTGVDFLVGYLSAIVNSVQSTPIKNHVATTSNTAHVQREADVVPFSTADLSVEEGEGHVDVAWFDYAYDEPATPAEHAVISLIQSTNWRVFYHRPTATQRWLRFIAGGADVIAFPVFSKGDVTRLKWRWRSGQPLELCVDGVCSLSSGDYTPPAAFDASGCWGSRDCTDTPQQLFDGGLRNARIL